jgi:hypothetical protein
MQKDSKPATKPNTESVSNADLQTAAPLTLKQLLLSDTARTDFLVPTRGQVKRHKFDEID